MHRSHWDLEVFAKDFQERRRREAEERRLVDQAVKRGASSAAGNPIDLAIGRLLHAWMARFDTKPAAEAPRPVAAPEPAVDANVVALPYRPKPAARTQPYADMVVIARGPAAGVAAEPSAVRDC